MFGYSLLQIYFMINFIYTIIMFFLLHKIIVKKIYYTHHKITSNYMTDREITISMNIFYVMGAFVGSIRLFKDVLNLLFDHKACIWLYNKYEDKE